MVQSDHQLFQGHRNRETNIVTLHPAGFKQSAGESDRGISASTVVFNYRSQSLKKGGDFA
jgi:hypothetical protein